jgi:hypothetical protein
MIVIGAIGRSRPVAVLPPTFADYSNSCGIARPFDIAVRHWLVTGQLRPLLQEWTGTRQAVTAVLPPHGRVASAKVRIYMDYVASLLSST